MFSGAQVDKWDNGWPVDHNNQSIIDIFHQVTETRDALVTRNVTVSSATKHLNKCYLETLNTMVTLQNQYLQSKNEKNIFQRYNRLRNMIKVRWLSPHY